jgi:hypothetical protein
MANEPVTYKFITGSSNAFANSAILAINSVTSPGSNLVIVPPTKADGAKRAYTRDAAYDPSKVPGAVVASSKFTMIFFAIIVITLLLLGVEIWMAINWPDPLTTLQNRVSSTVDKALTAALGAIFGLLGGKQIK